MHCDISFFWHSTLDPRLSTFQYLAEESNPVLQIRSLPCSSVTLAR
jgi:hypothetical protein